MNPDLDGAVRLHDAEGAPDVDLFADSTALRQYHGALDEFLAENRESCHRRCVPYLLLSGAHFEECFLPALARSGLLA